MKLSAAGVSTGGGTGPGWRDFVLSGALILGVVAEVIFGSLRWPFVVGLFSVLICALLPYRRVLPLAAAGLAPGIQT